MSRKSKCDVISCGNKSQVWIAFNSLKKGPGISYQRHVCLEHLKDTAIEFSQKIENYCVNTHHKDEEII